MIERDIPLETRIRDYLRRERSWTEVVKIVNFLNLRASQWSRIKRAIKNLHLERKIAAARGREQRVETTTFYRYRG